MDYRHYIGVDVSKHTLDFTVLVEGSFLLHETVDNTKPAIDQWLKKLKTNHKAGGKKTLFCVENTGTYQAILLRVLLSRKIPLWLESPLQIHLCLGLQRGKSDKLDSLRIAEYAYTFRKKVRLYQAPRDAIEQLKQLRSLRERLLTVRNQLKHQTEELKGYAKKAAQEQLYHHCEDSLAAIAGDLKKVEKTMLAMITADERISQLYQWLTSVSGIGPVLATEMIITTNEFKDFTNPKKYASYCGVAPFRYTSGVKIHKKAKVSKRANQRMRRLLHIAAMSSIQAKGEHKEYYDRRVKQGLNKTSVLNIIRNKLIRRAFACVREERCYNK